MSRRLCDLVEPICVLKRVNVISENLPKLFQYFEEFFLGTLVLGKGEGTSPFTIVNVSRTTAYYMFMSDRVLENLWWRDGEFQNFVIDYTKPLH